MEKKILPVIILFLLVTSFLMISLSVAFAEPLQTIWERTYDISDGGALYGVATDSSNSVVVAGVDKYWGQWGDWVTVKYSTDGNFLWSRIYDTGTWEGPFAGVAIDLGDNVYTGGNPHAAGLYDYHIVKYDPSGGYLWGRIFDAGGDDWSTSVTVDLQGNPLIIGYQHALFTSTLVKYDPNGSVLWSKTYPIYFEIGEVKLDSQNNIILGGMTYSADTGVDYYVAKLDPEGTVIWQRTYNSGGTAYDYGYAVAVDSQDNIIVTGDRITQKYDPLGNVLWTRIQTGTDIATDTKDNILVVTGSEIAKLNKGGLLLWNEPLSEYISKITVDKSNDIVIAGTLTPLDYWGDHNNDFIVKKLREVVTLQAPTELTATAKSSSRIDLSWKAPTPKTGLVGYKIERSPNGSTNWQVIGDIPSIDTTSYSDTGLTSSTAYYYRVRSYDPEGNTSNPTNVASASTYTVGSVSTGGVPVELGNGVSLTFSNVIASGTATVEVPDTPPPPDFGFSVSRALYFDITSTATYSGPILIALPYGEIKNPKVMHYESGKWKDVTIKPPDPDFPQVMTNPDTVNKIIYGKVTTLSPFAIVEPAAAIPTGYNTSWLLITAISLIISGWYLLLKGKRRLV